MVGLVAVMVIGALVGGLMIGLDALGEGTAPGTAPSTASPPAETPEGKEEEAQLVLEEILVRLDELPAGWYQAAFQDDTAGQYLVDGVRAVFRNKKYATPEEEISVANSVSLCEEEEAAVYLLQGGRSVWSDFEELSLGDGGFFWPRGRCLGLRDTVQKRLVLY